jgi:hypothetical protein
MSCVTGQTKVSLRDLSLDEAGDQNKSGLVRAPMHGKVLGVLVEPGEQVIRGQRLAIIEAMKMEHTLLAPVDGTVTEIAVITDAQVAEGAKVMQIAPAQDGKVVSGNAASPHRMRRLRLVADPEGWIKQKLKAQKQRGKKPERIHTTRMVPKRADELIDGGSIFWVIRGQIICRERILDIRPFTDRDGIHRCRLVLDPKCVLVEPRPRSAFQGWRYLEAKEAPRDLSRAAPGAAKMPEQMRRELRELGRSDADIVDKPRMAELAATSNRPAHPWAIRSSERERGAPR